MKSVFLSTLAAGLMAALPALADEQQASIDVSEMTCPTCSFTVARSMRNVPTVTVVDFQDSEAFGEGIFVVTFDDAITTPEAIVEAVAANGYPAHLLTTGETLNADG